MKLLIALFALTMLPLHAMENAAAKKRGNLVLVTDKGLIASTTGGFAAHTPVLINELDTQTEIIGDLTLHNTVVGLQQNEKKEDFPLLVITDNYVHQVDSIFKIVFSDGSIIEAAADQVFWCPDVMLLDSNVPGHWLPAQELQAGIQVYSKKIKDLTVASIVEEVTPFGREVYNIELENCHLFFVGTAQVLVHNANWFEKAGKKVLDGFAKLDPSKLKNLNPITLSRLAALQTYEKHKGGGSYNLCQDEGRSSKDVHEEEWNKCLNGAVVGGLAGISGGLAGFLSGAAIGCMGNLYQFHEERKLADKQCRAKKDSDQAPSLTIPIFSRPI